MPKKYSIVWLCLLLSFCLLFNPTGRAYAENENELPQYWKTSVQTPRGIVIVVHGLNVRPSKMGSPGAEGTLIKLLLDGGYHVFRVTLKGHGGPVEDMQNVTWSDWTGDGYSQYCSAKTFAENEQLPLYLLGFSLGALVYEVLMNEETAIPVQFEKAVLFSPAVAIKPAAKKILMLQPFTNNSSIIKSVSPEEYRAQRGASMGAYKIVFQMEEALCAAAFRNSNTKTIIFIDKDDEMISVALLRERINQFGLNHWTIFEVTNKGAAIKGAYHHLLIDTQCVSPSTWRFISDTMLNFLSQP